MVIFRRHIITSIFIVLYCGCWGYTIHWFTWGNASYPNSCGAANGGLLVIDLIVTVVYGLIFFINILFQKGDNKLDYLKFLLIIIAVPAILCLYFTVASLFSASIN